MGEQSLGRRQVLRGAGVVAAGGAAVTAVSGLGLASPAIASDDGGGGLTGSWMVTRQDDGDPTRVRAVFSFAGGGVFVEHDILPAGPPFTGTWARRDGGRFRATIWSGFPGEGGPGSPGVAVRVRLVGRLEHRTISGTYTATVFDSTGTPLESNTGKFSGQPISA
jgi:hypothetical protein